jgi:predicted GNAT family acetyltransferase
MNAILVRTATAADAATIVRFQQAMAFETEELRLEEGRVTAGVARVLSDPTKGRYYVAENDGTVVGMLLTIPEWSDWRNGTVIWIHSVYVRPEHRRTGVFGRLFAHIKAEVVASPELCGLRLYVEKRNTQAQAVYQRLGMKSDHYELFEWLK